MTRQQIEAAILGLINNGGDIRLIADVAEEMTVFRSGRKPAWEIGPVAQLVVDAQKIGATIVFDELSPFGK